MSDKFGVGSKVRVIKPDDVIENGYNVSANGDSNSWVDDMNEEIGLVFTIEDASVGGGYDLKESGWNYLEEWLELVVDNRAEEF